MCRINYQLYNGFERLLAIRGCDIASPSPAYVLHLLNEEGVLLKAVACKQTSIAPNSEHGLARPRAAHGGLQQSSRVEIAALRIGVYRCICYRPVCGLMHSRFSLYEVSQPVVNTW